MVNRISLGQATSSNLLQLMQVGKQMGKTQDVLATGCCVNSAIDNPSSYYTASSLNNRAKDLSALLDSMSQKTQTLTAALTGIESANSFLEQMTSVAEQAIINSESASAGESGPTIEDFIAQGYKVVTSSTTTGEFQALLDAGEKIVLSKNIVIDSGLTVTNSAVINGNGHSISFATDYGGAIFQASGEDVTLEISNLYMKIQGQGAAAVQALNGATVRIDDFDNIIVSNGAIKTLNGVSATYNGKANTAAFLDELGLNAIAAYAATRFYAPGVDKTDATFGQGQWYVPALGELMEVYGTNYEAISTGDGATGATGANKTAINDALSELAGKDVDAAQLSEDHYWSSSELPNSHIWRVNIQTGGRGESKRDYAKYIRFFQRVYGAYNPADTETTAPIVGDVMYADKSYGSASDYDGSKVAVGIITQIGEDGAITIMSLKDATFSHANKVARFNPDEPYTSAVDRTYFTLSTVATQNIPGVDDYDLETELGALKSRGTIELLTAEEETEPIEDPPDGGGGGEATNGTNFASWSAQYNALLAQYDSLINDSGYQGVNLLKGDSMEVTFNEDRDHKLTITGPDVRSSTLGLNSADWESIADIRAAISELKTTVSALRTAASDIGNNVSIIQIRQNFTEDLINVLEEGADKLTLADMDEASAEYLMLQTRQQLAVNALSLATEAERSVLSLF